MSETRLWFDVYGRGEEEGCGREGGFNKTTYNDGEYRAVRVFPRRALESVAGVVRGEDEVQAEVELVKGEAMRWPA